jgi:hypothetical protein
MSMRALIRNSVVALFVAAAALPAIAQETSRKIVTTENGDYFGFDLRTEQNLSLQGCEAACIDDKACKAFTYNPKVQWCFLKSDFNQLNAFPGAVAGKIVEVVNEPDIGAPQKLAFVTDQLTQEALKLKTGGTVMDAQRALGADALASSARADVASGNYPVAIDGFTAALAIAPDNGAWWAEMAAAANQVTNNYAISSKGAAAALNAYQLSRTASARAQALALLAGSFDRTQNYRAALSA